MQVSETTSKIFPALIKARTDIAAVPRSKEGYGYKYVTLDDILNMLKEVLPKYGLGFVQFPETVDGHDGVTTTVIHESGEYISARYEMEATPVKGTNVTQQKGASITYTRRYALASIFGIASEEDTDGVAGGKPEATQYMTEEQRSIIDSFSPNWVKICDYLKVSSPEEITYVQADALIRAKREQAERSGDM